MTSIFTWLKQFRDVWLPSKLPNDHTLLESIQGKITEFEQIIIDHGVVDEEEYNRAKLLNDSSSETSDNETTAHGSASFVGTPLESSLPTPPDLGQPCFDQDQQEQQAKQILLSQSDSESNLEDTENDASLQRPVIRLKRLASNELRNYDSSCDQTKSEQIDRPSSSSMSSSDDEDYRIRTRLKKQPLSTSRSVVTRRSSNQRHRSHDVVIHYDSPKHTAAPSPPTIETHSDNERETLDQVDSPSIPTSSPLDLSLNQPEGIDHEPAVLENDQSDSELIMEVCEEQQPIEVPSYSHLMHRHSAGSDEELHQKKRLLDSSFSSCSRSSRKRRKVVKQRMMIDSSTDRSEDSTDSDTKSNGYDQISDSEWQNKTNDKQKEILTSSSTDDEEIPTKKSLRRTTGRKNIRKILDDKELDAQTKHAIAAEQERRERIAGKQKTYNESLMDRSSDLSMIDGVSRNDSKPSRLILEFDKTTNEPLIEVDEKLVEYLKPHQCEGVQFLWNNVFESVEAIEKKKQSTYGCILAHCMGLGKTLQAISFIHTISKYQELTKTRTYLVLCPINAALNWSNEFDYWLKNIEPPLDYYQLTTIKPNLRTNYVTSWYESGGVMIMGYELYRRLANGLGMKRKSSKQDMYRCLVDPGPDLIIADEGHILKNAQTALAKCLSKIRTARRVVLTGTPLQNNLIEYYCMVSFIKPNLLGTQQEYINRFVNPIQNGQHRDSNEEDVRLMKRRACVLHELLAGFIDRKDYSLLKEYLPPKFEYIIKIRLSDLQSILYDIYLRQQVRYGQTGTISKRDFQSAKLFADYQFLQKIWTHPFLLYPHFIDRWKKKSNKDEEILIDDVEIAAMLNDVDDGESKSKKSKSKTSCGFLIDNVNSRSTRRTSSSSSAKTIESNDSDVLEIGDESDDDAVKIIRSYPTRNRTTISEPNEISSTQNEDPWLNEMREQFWFPFLDMLPDESRFDIELSGKFLLLKAILDETEDIGDKVLLFSRSLYTLNHIEAFLHFLHKQNESEYLNQCQLRRMLTDETLETSIPAPTEWIRDRDYFRMDGQTDVTARKRYARAFNDPSNHRARLFLISTLAGGIGINLTGSNRVIIFDASWNPSHDTQAIFRSYRFGQKKPVYIYRFLAYGTMEEKIYQRQVVKQSLSQRVIDDHQLDRHFTQNDIKELYRFQREQLPETKSISSLLDESNGNFTYSIPKDHLLLDLLYKHHRWIHSYHSHDSLLENKIDEGLTAEERRRALEEYENLKKIPDYRQLHAQRLQQQQQLNEMIARQNQLNTINPAANEDLQRMIADLFQSAVRTTSTQSSNPSVARRLLPNRIQQVPPLPSTKTNQTEVICLESDDETTRN